MRDTRIVLKHYLGVEKASPMNDVAFCISKVKSETPNLGNGGHSVNMQGVPGKAGSYWIGQWGTLTCPDREHVWSMAP